MLSCLYISFIEDDRSRRQHLTDKFNDWVVHLNTILARRGGNLNDRIFKSSNARALPGRGECVEVSSWSARYFLIADKTGTITRLIFSSIVLRLPLLDKCVTISGVASGRWNCPLLRILREIWSIPKWGNVFMLNDWFLHIAHAFSI